MKGIPNLNQFMRLSMGSFTPHNEVELSFSHLRDEGVEDIENYNDMVDKFSLLANIKSDKLMNVYMQQLHIFNALLPFANSNPQIHILLNNLFHRWKAELSLSRAYGGTERKLQANAARPQVLNSYGGSMEEQEEEPKKSNKKNNLFDRFIP